jgi:transposase-like protein
MINKQLHENMKGEAPEVEVEATPARRRAFTSAYKRQVLDRAEALVGQGEGKLGAYLRKEGLYSSHLTQWRRQQNQGLLKDVKRGRAPSQKEAVLKENVRLKRALVSLEKRAKQAEFLVDLQKKMAEWMAAEPEITTA